jgi:hypothetical protein
MLMQLRMRPELEAIALSRATPGVLRASVLLIVCVSVGLLIGFHGSVDLFSSGVGIALLVLIPIGMIALTLRMKGLAKKNIRGRFASLKVTLYDECLIRTMDGYPDLTMRWDEVKRVVDRGENGLVLSPTRAEDSVILFSEFENYAFAKEFVLARVPEPVSSVYTLDYVFRMALSIASVAVFCLGLLSYTRWVVGICLVALILYAIYGLRSFRGPNVDSSVRKRSQIFFIVFPIVLLLRMIFL